MVKKAVLLILSLSLGLGAGELMASDKAPFYCERNACRLSTGNCDMVAHPMNCWETGDEQGCDDDFCPVE